MGTHVFRKGDKVSIEGVVDYASTSQAKINVGDTYTSVFVDLGSINLVMPCFTAGERVVHVGGIEVGHGPGEVVATHGDMVWLNLDNGGLKTLPAYELILEAREVSAESVEAVEPLTLHGSAEVEL